MIGSVADRLRSSYRDWSLGVVTKLEQGLGVHGGYCQKLSSNASETRFLRWQRNSRRGDLVSKQTASAILKINEIMQF